MPKKLIADMINEGINPIIMTPDDWMQLAPGSFTGKRVLVATLGHVGKALLRRDDGMYQVWFIDFEHAEPAPAQKTVWVHESELETTGLPMSWPEGEGSDAD